MPISGNNETGVKPAGLWHSGAGIPIKKRRYPMIWPPSPPSEELSSSLVDSSSLHKDQTSPSQGSTLSCMSTSSSCLVDGIRNPEAEERRDVANCHVRNKGNVSISEVKVEVPESMQKLSAAANVVDQMASGKKIESNLAPTKPPANRVVSVKGSLDMAPSVSLTGNLGANTHVCLTAHVKVESNSAFQEKPEELLSLKEHFHPVLPSQKSDKSDRNQEISEPISLKLSLSKVSTSGSHCKDDGDDDLNGGSSHLCADRANWDLNTPMDKWVGPANDMVAGEAYAPEDLKLTTVTTERCRDAEQENSTSPSVLPKLSSQTCKSGEYLNAAVSPGLQSNCKDRNASTLKLNSGKVILYSELPKVVGLSSSSFNKVVVGNVKAEPVDDSLKRETGRANSVLLDNSVVKEKLCDRGSLEALKPLTSCGQKPVDPRSIKLEPVLDLSKRTINEEGGKSFQLKEKVLQEPAEHSTDAGACQTPQIVGSAGNNNFPAGYKHSATATVKTAETSYTVRSSSFTPEFKPSSTESGCPTSCSLSTELPMRGDLSSHSGQLTLTKRSYLEEACGSSRPLGPDLCASGDTEVERENIGGSNAEKQEVCKSEVPSDPLCGNGMVATLEEEKVNTYADIEVSYGTDYESDGNHAIDMSIDMEIDSEDDYEDGEVRDSLENLAVKQSGFEKEQFQQNHSGDLSSGNVNTVGFVNDADRNSSHVGVPDEKNVMAETDKDAEEASIAARTVVGSCKALSLPESSTIDNSLGGSLLEEAVFGSQLGQPVLEYQETVSNQAGDGGSETLAAGFVSNEYDMEPKHDMDLNNSSVNGDTTGNDIDIGSQRSRIINLPRSSNSSSPGRNRNYSAGRFLPARTERERLSDLALEGDNIHSRGREDIYNDGIQKFSRERHHPGQTPRNSRLNFMQGRINNRESNREFASEFYNGPAGYPGPRHKFASSGSEADLGYNSYNAAQDVPFVGSGRGGRKPLNDGGPFFRRLPSRRRSPGVGRGMHNMVRRPNRFVTDRRNIRDFRDDGIDPMFQQPQSSYEGVDGHFPQGNRNFQTGQRRVMHRIRSKSPLGSRTRSPGGWSSPRRRSPDGFSGPPDLPRQRSPPFYRMRSPDRRCFPGEGSVVRRQDMREMDSGRDHGHPGAVMPNSRSPSGRVVIRERRFGGLDTQERREGDEFYGGPMHSGSLHEIDGDANGEERRFGDRRGPLRPYRTSFSGADGESLHHNAEDGSRPLRFCSDDNPDSQERDNLVERDFNRRIKSRPVNPPRRMRNMDELEGNYRQGNQVWHNNNNNFHDMSRDKRKRY